MPTFEQKPNIGDLIKTITATTYTVTDDPGTIYVNTGAVNGTIYTLPTSPIVGAEYSFVNVVSQAVTIRAPGARITNKLGQRLNFISCKIPGAMVSLVWDGTAWNTHSSIATWSGFGFSGLNKQFINSAISHSCFTIDSSTGFVWAWGYNNYGQLGNNVAANTSSPVSVVGGNIFTQIATGNGFTAALDQNGLAWAWGGNNYGQLGVNNTANTSSPVSVLGGKTFTSVAAGRYQVMALDQNGLAWGWGQNTNSQLGDNTAVDKSSPVSVVGGKTFTQITAGVVHFLALDQNGQAWACGWNGSGQLGDGATAAQSSPVSVVGGKTFTQIVGAGNRSAAIEAGTGIIWAWGFNSYGQLGVNDTTDRSSPVSIIGGNIFTAIACGALHSLALDQNGQAWAWGYNNYGQLGVGDTTSRSSPIAVVGGKTFVAIATGTKHSVALEAGTGIVWCWGYNNRGQLGVNDTANRSSPVSVVRLFL